MPSEFLDSGNSRQLRTIQGTRSRCHILGRESVRSVGFDATMPEGTYFLYTKAPKGCAGLDFPTAEDASQFLITQQSVCTVPWDDAGAHLRFSVTYTAATEQDEDNLMRETCQRLGALASERPTSRRPNHLSPDMLM